MKSRVDSFIPLKANWLHILVALSDGDQHGYGIMQDVLERTQGKVRLWPASLYGTLKKLIDEDLIEESPNRPRVDDDSRRKYYRMTDLGRRVLAAESQRLRELVQFLDGSKPKAAGAL
jgi:DNA-binding PadR family transcriptional regulator